MKPLVAMDARSGTRTPDWFALASAPESGYPWSSGDCGGVHDPVVLLIRVDYGESVTTVVTTG
jgi:hypothetical protein